MARFLSVLPTLAVLMASTSAEVTSVTVQPVVSLFLDPIEGVTFAASVISAEPTATLYHVECATTATTKLRANLCTYVKGLTVYQGPSTCSAEFTAVYNPSSTLYEQFVCDITGTLAFCTDVVSETGVAKTFPSVYGNLTSSMSPVTITAGAEKLAAVAVTTSSGAAQASSGSAGLSSVPTGVVSGGSSASSAAASTAANASSSAGSKSGVSHIMVPSAMVGLFSVLVAAIMI